jgi:hypothetical protein
MDNTIDQWARAALHATGHSDQQIDAMRLKAVEDAKPKPRVIIPWKPIPPEAWDKYAADLAAQRATTAHQNRLAAARRATEVARMHAEEAEAKVRELNRAMDDNSH